MLSNAKSIMIAMVLWLVEKPARTAAVLIVFGLVATLALSIVFAPESAAIAASATSGSP